MVTSPTERLELPNFGHMTTSTIEFESGNKILLLTSWTEGLEQPFMLTSAKL